MFWPRRVTWINAGVGWTTRQRGTESFGLRKVGRKSWIQGRDLLLREAQRSLFWSCRCSKRFALKPKFLAWNTGGNVAHDNSNLHLKKCFKSCLKDSSLEGFLKLARFLLRSQACKLSCTGSCGSCGLLQGKDRGTDQTPEPSLNLHPRLLLAPSRLPHMISLGERAP